MLPFMILALAAALAQSQYPPRPPAQMREKAVSSSNVPVSETAIVTWMMQGPAETPSELMFVVWRGKPGWNRGSPRSSSGGGSDSRFSSSATFGSVRVDFEFDRSRRIANVQGKRIEMGDANVVLVDGVDLPGATRIHKILRVEYAGDLQRGPAGPVRALAASPEILEFIGCPPPDPAAASFCRLVLGDERVEVCTD
jgi:hypothetical protein